MCARRSGDLTYVAAQGGKRGLAWACSSGAVVGGIVFTQWMQHLRPRRGGWGGSGSVSGTCRSRRRRPTEFDVGAAMFVAMDVASLHLVVAEHGGVEPWRSPRGRGSGVEHFVLDPNASPASGTAFRVFDAGGADEDRLFGLPLRRRSEHEGDDLLVAVIGGLKRLSDSSTLLVSLPWHEMGDRGEVGERRVRRSAAAVHFENFDDAVFLLGVAIHLVVMVHTVAGAGLTTSSL